MASTVNVFISYVSDDAPVASAVKEYLEEVFLNATVFVSGENLSGGEVWMEELRVFLAAATAVIGIITPASEKSNWVHFELGAGFTNKRAIPLVGDGITFGTLKAPLKLLQGRALDEDGLKALARDVARFAELREPSKFPGLEACLERARECFNGREKARQSRTGTNTGSGRSLASLLQPTPPDPDPFQWTVVVADSVLRTVRS
jgi:hypothetical protein